MLNLNIELEFIELQKIVHLHWFKRGEKAIFMAWHHPLSISLAFISGLYQEWCLMLTLFNKVLLCSWDKSLNIGSRMLRIFLKVPSFTFDSLNCMQQIRSYSFYILVIGQKSFIFLMMFWIIWLCLRYNQKPKGIKEKGLSWKVSRSTK